MRGPRRESISLVEILPNPNIDFTDFTAFSIFAFVEYFVAASNMFFYWTILDDLPDEEIVVLKPLAGAATAFNGGDKESEAAPAANGHCSQKMPDDDLALETKKDQ